MAKTQAKADTKVVVEKNNAGKTGSFVRENQKSLLFIVGAILVLAIGYLIYLKMYLAPREVQATNQMYVAQNYFEKKDWDKAINGDAGYPGFKKIIDDYGSTKA